MIKGHLIYHLVRKLNKLPSMGQKSLVIILLAVDLWDSYLIFLFGVEEYFNKGLQGFPVKLSLYNHREILYFHWE